MNRDIKEKREEIFDAPALYFIEPTKENLDMICNVSFLFVNKRIVKKIYILNFI
jgi:hypothetical protein